MKSPSCRAGWEGLWWIWGQRGQWWQNHWGQTWLNKRSRPWHCREVTDQGELKAGQLSHTSTSVAAQPSASCRTISKNVSKSFNIKLTQHLTFCVWFRESGFLLKIKAVRLLSRCKQIYLSLHLTHRGRLQWSRISVGLTEPTRCQCIPSLCIVHFSVWELNET